MENDDETCGYEPANAGENADLVQFGCGSLGKCLHGHYDNDIIYIIWAWLDSKVDMPKWNQPWTMDS